MLQEYALMKLREIEAELDGKRCRYLQPVARDPRRRGSLMSIVRALGRCMRRSGEMLEAWGSPRRESWR